MTITARRIIPAVVGALVLALLAIIALKTEAQAPSTGGVRFEGVYDRADDYEELVFGMDSLIAARIQAVRGPFWNTRTGKPWADRERGRSRAEWFSEVTVRVLRVYWGPVKGPEATIVVRGDANLRWERSGTPEDWNRMSGGFAPGDRHLLGITQRPFEYEFGVKRAWTLSSNFQSNWRIIEGSVVDDQLGGDQTLGELVRKLEAARPGRDPATST